MAQPTPTIEDDEAAAEARALAVAIAIAEADPRRVPHEKARPWLLRLAAGEFAVPPPSVTSRWLRRTHRCAAQPPW